MQSQIYFYYNRHSKIYQFCYIWFEELVLVQEMPPPWGE